jgi:hypothetical protein
MTPLRWLMVAFWVFVGGMLAWQAYNHEAKIEKEADAKPQHFFFDSSKDGTPQTADPNLRAADVRQTAYSVTENPLAKNFTAHVVLTNKGNARAVSVQVKIQPFRGSLFSRDRDDNGGVPLVLSDNEPVAQINQWVEAPDLAPQESCTVTATFMSQTGVQPGANRNPQIIFQTEKANP